MESDESYWLTTAPGFEAAPPRLPASAEVAVLGAGIMGAALAYWLADFGCEAVVFERNGAPAHGATGRNGGLHVAGPATNYAAAARQFGLEAAREIYHATRENDELIAGILRRESIDARRRVTGFLTLAGSGSEADELRASASALRAGNFEAEWLERAEVVDRLGAALAPDYTGALFTPNDSQLHSARYALGVAEAAQRRGARFVFSTPVTRLKIDAGGRGWQIVTPRGELPARHVVAALNAWAGDLFPELGRLISVVRGHVIQTAPVGFRLTPWGANQGYEYGRQLDDGGLLAGGMRRVRADQDRGYEPDPGQNAPPAAPEVVAALTGFVPRIFPEAGGVPIVRRWTGLMGFTPDLNPLAGPWPGRPGLWLLAGFSGHGMPYSQVLPQAIAAQIAGRAGPRIPAAFGPDRFLS